MAEHYELEQRMRFLEERRPGLEERLQQAIRERAELTPLIKMEERAATDVLASPSAARAQFKDVFHLADREALVQQRVAREQGLLNFLREESAQRRGKVEDVVKGLVGAFEAEQAGLTARFQRWATREQLRIAAMRAGGVGDQLTAEDIAKWSQRAGETYQSCRAGGGSVATCRRFALQDIPEAAKAAGELSINASEALWREIRPPVTIGAPTAAAIPGGTGLWGQLSDIAGKRTKGLLERLQRGAGSQPAPTRGLPSPGAGRPGSRGALPTLKPRAPLFGG